MKRTFLRIPLVGLCTAAISFGQSPAARDLTQYSLEDLLNIRVTSVSKKEQALSKTGAAVHVITQEEIRRSGANNIPDLLRMVPGVDVARIDSNSWAISVRGSSDRYANKVLVLIDGRSVYNPGFSGVFWEEQDVPLEDIERIEVIRGPGGTVWGANAVNGVINIITKTAKDTRGGTITAGTGSEATADGLGQYGGNLGPKGTYRVFGKYSNVVKSVLPNGGEAADGWHASHVGFRTDWDLSPRDTMTVEGEVLKTNAGQTITTLFSQALPLVKTLDDRLSVTAGNVLAHWKHTLKNGSDLSVQIYDDYANHMDQGFRDISNTVDLDSQYHLALGSRNDIVWGMGARAIHNHYGEGYAITIAPQHRMDFLFSTFLQDEVRITDSLWLTLGSKFEHNDFTGSEIEPSVQMVWEPASRQTFWVSAARAIRQPSPVDFGIQADVAIVPLPEAFAVVKLQGNSAIKEESVQDFEAGYRTQLSKRLSLDATSFGSLFSNLETIVPGMPYFAMAPGIPHLVLPQIFKNGGPLHTYGGEFSATWTVSDHWRLTPGYSFLHTQPEDSVVHWPSPGANPKHQVQLQSRLDLRHNLEWDNTVKFVSRLSAGDIPAYVRLDSRIGWQAGESLEFSVVGQNLLTPRHAEFYDGNYAVSHTLVERSVFGKITWRF
jgi:iron complex outermembrane receptor protein